MRLGSAPAPFAASASAMCPEPPKAVPTATLTDEASAFNLASRSFALFSGESVRTAMAVTSLKICEVQVKSLCDSVLAPVM